jgi:hypothetical protein
MIQYEQFRDAELLAFWPLIQDQLDIVNNGDGDLLHQTVDLARLQILWLRLQNRLTRLWFEE